MELPAQYYDLYRDCRLCPRQCGVDRIGGETGYCGETATLRVASCGPHHGEEPSISGTRGSGTIFFTGCPCRCLFCQNYQISMGGIGKEVKPAALLEMAAELSRQGVHNLNFVTPTHFHPHIIWLSKELRRQGVGTPFVYNCSGYELPRSIRLLAEDIDIFMPDFKFALPALADEIIGAADYPELALASLREMVEAKGFLTPFGCDRTSPAETGVLVRHLVLPGQVQNSLHAMRMLRREFGRMLPLSIMSQYRPMPACRERAGLMRTLTKAEYEQVCSLVEELDFQQVFLQPYFHDTGFVPDFREEEPFEGNRV